MTHQQRLQWLASHGFLLASERTVTLPGYGPMVWIDGNKGLRPVSLWFAVDDGKAILHGTDLDFDWHELQAWIEPPLPVVAVPVVKQKTLNWD
jgi:hypothetical protein